MVLDPGCASAISPYDSEQFKFLKEGVKRIYPDVETAPYVMNSASDCRYMSCVSEHCLRFTPFLIDDQQLESIHGVNENVNLSALAPAVDFYRYVIREV